MSGPRIRKPRPRPKFLCRQCMKRRVWKDWTLCSRCQAEGATIHIQGSLPEPHDGIPF